MPTVYVVNKSGHNFSKAKKFGKLAWLSEGWVDKWDLNTIFREMVMGLANSKPTDYILMTGLPIQNIIAACVFSMKHGRLNLLIYKGGNYTVNEIRLSNLVRKEDENTTASSTTSN